MPEFPDIVVYLECLYPRVIGQKLQRIRLFNPFLLRSVEPPIETAESKTGRKLRLAIAKDNWPRSIEELKMR